MNVTVCNDKKLKACLAVSISLQHNCIIIKKNKDYAGMKLLRICHNLHNYAVVLESQKHSTSPYSNDRLTKVIFRPNVMYF